MKQLIDNISGERVDLELPFTSVIPSWPGVDLVINIQDLPIYPNDAKAWTWWLSKWDLYHTETGELRIKL